MCIWDSNRFSKLSVLKNRYFLLISGQIRGSLQIVMSLMFMARVTSTVGEVWRELADIMEGVQGAWILIGDFNDVRFQEERLNSVFNLGCAAALNDFVFEAGLHEYAMKG